jgi:hypothetical protein
MTLIGVVRVVCIALGVLCLGAAATVALVPLPAPAAGGTCGPGTASEAPIVAFFDPVSIGAGPYPSATSGNRAQWRAFVSECQSATNTRMEVALAILVGSLLLVIGLPWAVRRFAVATGTDDAAPSVPGWYPDRAGTHTARWWDGRDWGPPIGPQADAGPRAGPDGQDHLGAPAPSEATPSTGPPA